MDSITDKEILEELKNRNIPALKDFKIQEMLEKMLNKDGYCLTEVGKWVVDVFKDVVRKNGFIINQFNSLDRYIDLLDISEDINVGDFLDTNCKNIDPNLFFKCINTWEKFISDEYPEFGYNREDEEDNCMDGYLALHFNHKNCGDIFFEDFVYNLSLTEVINYYNK